VLLAALAVPAVHLLLQATRAGYALRAVGHASEAARYAGIAPPRMVVAAMAVSGALAGMVGLNEIAGVHGRLLLDFVAGAGFAGIAVSLIGRNHPVGIVLAALLFGALYQGGAELAFELQGFSRDMVFVLQGLIVLFAGALTPAVSGWLLGALRTLRGRQAAASGSAAGAGAGHG
jgi:simple sugar transport system permease protein